jgi:hypothetical protein
VFSVVSLLPSTSLTCPSLLIAPIPLTCTLILQIRFRLVQFHPYSLLTLFYIM